MSKKTDSGDSTDAGDSAESGEYEDDFENDLEWLINEEEMSSLGETEKEEDIETKIDKELEFCEENDDSTEREEPIDQFSEPDIDLKERPKDKKYLEATPEVQQLDLTSDSDSESSIQESKLENQEELDEEDEEIKRYILEKIETANKLLENQAPVDENRERKLKFKEKLVDLEVPPLEDAEAYNSDPESEGKVLVGLSQLQISNEPGQEGKAPSLDEGKDEEHRDGKILVEKDGKFELLSLQDIESQGFLPPISVSFTDIETQPTSPKSSHPAVFGTPARTKEESVAQQGVNSFSPVGEHCMYFPKPPPNPKCRPKSATSIAKNVGRGKTPHRVQSANNVPLRSSTYCLSPRQKELQKQIEQKKEKLRKEEEAQRREQEEQKRRENEMVFRAWLQKKKGQVQEEKRIQRAKEMEDLNSRVRKNLPTLEVQQEDRNPEEAFKLWLKKKQQEQLKEKQMEFLKHQEQSVNFFPRTEDCDRAFREWLKRKRKEKRAEELAAKERSRQLRLEARRAKQIQNIMCTISEPKSFRFTDHYS
ncbi:PREDICTED: coiled-coil domain-containing protein 181 isoform X1 [Gavialis gangeticus]|uniref:coiled-coil domain-containing protein 181 isoform X1 n=1 Tax=Gavialis gangeticus TaxID=94835 RepID=UPI00092F9F0E|nr:PREDICTED: coiled-coil domain-containing protein 181 isoform X1 [Gavialis gangeticus]